MKRFSSFYPFAAALAAITVLGVAAASAQEIASHALPTSALAGIATDNAHAIDDAAFCRQIQAQLQSVLSTASKELPWKAQIVAPETLGWEKGRSEAGAIIAALNNRLKASGYTVTLNDLGEHDGSHIKFLMATRPGQVLIGAWFLSDSTTILGWGFAAPSVAGSGDVLVPGTPALTEGIVNSYTDYLVWLFGKPELGKAREQVRQVSAAYLGDQWKNGRAGAMAGTLMVLHGMTNSTSLSKSEQEGARHWLLHRLRVAAYAGKPDDRAAESIMAVYEVLDPTVAKAKPGAPPLSKSVRDDYVAVQGFMLSRITGGVTLSPEEKTAVGSWLVSAFPNWSADEQRKLAQSSLTWATLQQEWEDLPAGKKAEAQKSWKSQLGPLAESIRKNRADAAKKVAEEKAAGTRLKAGKINYADVMKKVEAGNRSYQFLSSAMTQMHYARMNSMAAWGGSPYRYVNQYGRPY
jgi:hypothetical protein